jgi:formylglycine-generating enzyme required for sulfatase activity
VVAYEMLVGRVPFPGDTPGTLNAHLNLTPPDPQTIRRDLPRGVIQVLLKALCKSPRARYVTATAMVEALCSGKRVPRKRFPVWGWVPVGMVVLALLIGGVWLVALNVRKATPTVTTAVVVGPTNRSAATDTPAPISIVPAAEVTQVWERDSSVMVYVPAGKFWMGSDDSDSEAAGDEKPQHEVYVETFWIDRTEVTTAQYRSCVAAGVCSAPSSFASSTRHSYYGNPECENYPVVNVNWNQANAYCIWIGKRLPTEAEWEKAARGTDGRLWPWGDFWDAARLNSIESGINGTESVGARGGELGQSPYGLNDMAGNVWEWTADWWGWYENPHRPPEDNLGWGRVIRGGSWRKQGHETRTTFRGRADPNGYSDDIGFRCAK